MPFQLLPPHPLQDRSRGNFLPHLLFQPKLEPWTQVQLPLSLSNVSVRPTRRRDHRTAVMHPPADHRQCQQAHEMQIQRQRKKLADMGRGQIDGDSGQELAVSAWKQSIPNFPGEYPAHLASPQHHPALCTSLMIQRWAGFFRHANAKARPNTSTKGVSILGVWLIRLQRETFGSVRPANSPIAWPDCIGLPD